MMSCNKENILSKSVSLVLEFILPMGGSPCKAWDWRNPIVQTLFTQGATRTACYAHGEIRAQTGGVVFGLSPRQRGCAARGPARTARFAQRRSGSPKAVARVGASQPPEPGLFRLWTAIYQSRLPIPWGGRGAADHAQAGQKRQRPPEGGSKTAQAGQKRQRPAGGAAGGRSPPGGGLWPPPCSARRPNAALPAAAGLQGFELSALLGILYPVA